MPEVILATAAIAALCVVVGSSLAVATRRPGDGWAGLTADALLLGLVLTPLGITVWDWLGVVGLVGLGLAWAAPWVLLARGRVTLPGRPAPGRPTVALGIGWVLLLAVTVALRTGESNFVMWVGDMGAYVNWANEFVRSGTLDAEWPPLFSSYLAIATSLFGTAHTTVGVPLTGIALVVAVGRLTRDLGAPAWVSLTAGAVVALHGHAVWFSTFPASESLNAPVLVVWLMLMVRMLRRGSVAVAVGLGAVTLGLCLLRSTGMILLVPVALVLLAALAVPAWRSRAPALWWTTVAAGIAVVVSYWYSISRIPGYFVRMQLPEYLPGRVYDAAARAGLFEPTPVTGLVLVTATAVVVAVGTVTVRWATARTWSGPGPRVALGALALAVAVVVVAQAWAGTEVWQILVRMGAVLILVALGATALAGWQRDVDRHLVVAVMIVTTGLFVALQAFRLKEPRTHAFHLYWDRYLFSEVLPITVALTFALVGWALLAVRAAAVDATWRHGEVVAGTVALAVVVVPGLPSLRLVTAGDYMTGAYPLVARLAEVAEERELPVFWSADAPGGVEGFFFPNTWMAFARPLETSFGVPMINVDLSGGGFAPDGVLDDDLVSRLAACEELDAFLLMEVEVAGTDAGERLTLDGVALTEVTSVSGEVDFLGQPRVAPAWYTVEFVIDVWEVALAEELTSQPCPLLERARP